MQTSINTIIMMAMDSIREKHGMTGKEFSKWLGVSQSNWSKATKGQASISIEMIHRVLMSYRHEGAVGLSEFFGVIDNVTSIIFAGGDDARTMSVKPNNLITEKKWDTLINPGLLSEEVFDVIRHYKTESRSKLNFFNLDGQEDLFSEESDYLLAQECDYREVSDYINSLPWYEKDKKDPDWVISLKEKVKARMHIAMRVYAEIKAARRTGEDEALIDAIAEMTRLSMTKKVIGESNGFSDSDAKKAIDRMKSGFHQQAGQTAS